MPTSVADAVGVVKQLSDDDFFVLCQFIDRERIRRTGEVSVTFRDELGHVLQGPIRAMSTTTTAKLKDLLPSSLKPQGLCDLWCGAYMMQLADTLASVGSLFQGSLIVAPCSTEEVHIEQCVHPPDMFVASMKKVLVRSPHGRRAFAERFYLADLASRSGGLVPEDVQFREWRANYSRLAAAVLNDYSNGLLDFPIRAGMKVLVVGDVVSGGLELSFLADLVGDEGEVIFLNPAEVIVDCVQLVCGLWPNVRQVEGSLSDYREAVSAVIMRTTQHWESDVTVLLSNAKEFLADNGTVVLNVDVSSDTEIIPQTFFGEVVHSLRKGGLRTLHAHEPVTPLDPFFPRSAMICTRFVRATGS